MKQTRLMMDMPITIVIEDSQVTQENINNVFDFFAYVDETFSIYKEFSEISKINRGELSKNSYSEDMKTILSLSEQTKKETNGYFDIYRNGSIDPSGIVKGWSIYKAAQILENDGFHNFYVDAGGDIQVSGLKDGSSWRVGIRNPFNQHEIVKVLSLTNCGIATSGTQIRGQHIFDPYHPGMPIMDIVSITVVGPNVHEADRFATAAFAMGKEGISFIEKISGLEGYMIDATGIATYTSEFGRFIWQP
jgi:thiamine biosynthesis lipoprotein